MQTWRKKRENRCKNLKKRNAENYTRRTGVRKSGCIAAGAKIAYTAEIAQVRAGNTALFCPKTSGGAI